MTSAHLLDEHKTRDELTAELRALRDARAGTEERFYTAFHASPDVIVITAESDARILDVNAAIERVFGHRREDAIGLTVIDLGVWQDVAERQRMLAMLRAEGEVRNFEIAFRTKTGTEGVCELSALPIEVDGKRCLLSVIRDISRQKRTEMALRAETNLLEGLMASLPGVFYVVDMSRKFQRWNRRLEQISGMSPDELARTEGRTLIVEEDHAEIERARDRLIAVGEAVAEVGVKAADGRTVPHLLNSRIVELGGERFILGVGIDVSEQRQLEREVLEISSRERDRIGADLHDGLGQQLTGMAFLARALERRLEALGLAESADARALGERLSSAVSQTRFLAWGLLPISVDTEGLTAALSRLAKNAGDVFQLRVDVRVGPGVRVESTDAAKHVCQIACEAITNAARHGRARRVVVDLGPVDDGIRLTVTDDGSGIPEGAATGEGLGLRIMRYRAHLISATLEVSRGDAGGTIVSCTLPRSGPARPAKAMA